MKILKVNFKDFKRFDDLTINLGDNPAKIVALVGPNGCGKSSVFDGFLIIQNMLYPIGQFGAKGANFFSKNNDKTYMSNYKDKINIITDKGELDSNICNRKNDEKEKTTFSFRSSYRYSSNLNITSLQTIKPIIENNIGASHSVDLDDKISNNYQRLYVYINNYRKENNLTDSQAIDNVIGTLNNIFKNVLDIKISDVGEILDNRGCLYFTKSDQDGVFEYNILSSGEKEVVDLLLDIFLKKDEFNDTIYCIDEPELHLNTLIQRHLLIELEKLIPDNCQLWVATHSMGFLRGLQEELKDKSQILDFSSGDYFTGSKTIIPIKTTRSNWQRIFKTALEDITELVAPKEIIYCEGKIDPSDSGQEEGLDAMVYNQIFSEEYHDTVFVSSGGVDVEGNAAVTLSLMSKVLNSIEFKVLKDKDDKTNQDRQDFIKDNPIHRMLERREIENYIFDEEILKIYCDANGVSFDEGKYATLISDIKGQDLITSNVLQPIQQLCGATGSIKDFKLKLSGFIAPSTSIYKELNICIFT